MELFKDYESTTFVRQWCNAHTDETGRDNLQRKRKSS